MPQAWAAGSVFHLVQAMLGLQADAPNHRLYLDPVLPAWLPDVTLAGLKVGRSTFELRFWRRGDGTSWEVSVREGDAEVEVEQKPWQPWGIEAAHR